MISRGYFGNGSILYRSCFDDGIRFFGNMGVYFGNIEVIHYIFRFFPNYIIIIS